MQLPDEERRETAKTQKIVKAVTPAALHYSQKEVDARTLHEVLSKPTISPHKTVTEKNSMFKSQKQHSKFFETQKTI